MKYNTIKINPTQTKSRPTISIFRDNEDREEVNIVPHTMGFYHYPSTMSDEDALARLKEAMIKDREKLIKTFKI